MRSVADEDRTPGLQHRASQAGELNTGGCRHVSGEHGTVADDSVHY